MRRMLLPILASLLASCSPEALLNATIPRAGTGITRDIKYGPLDRQTLDVYRPPGATGSAPLVVFLYGGSWKTGSKDTYPFVALALARRGAVVVLPDYRVYPNVGFPLFLQDNAAATAWAFAHAAEWGADPHAIFLMGHSAGAYNAAMIALDPAFLADHGVNRNRLAGVIGLATPADFLPSHDPDVAPVFGAANTPANQPLAYADGHNPPLLLLSGDADAIVQPRNTVTLAAAIRQRGGPVESRLYPGIGHIGIITAFAPLFQGRAPSLEDSWRFIEAHRPQIPAQNSATTQPSPANQMTDRMDAQPAK